MMVSRDRAGLALLALALLLASLGAIAPIVDFDIFYHLAIGDWVLEEQRVPHTGLFSGTRGHEPWVDGEWGFQAVAAAAYRMGGWPALVVLNAGLLTLALALVGWCLIRRGVPVEGVVLALGLVHLSRVPLLFRPQLVSAALLGAALILITDLIDGRAGASGRPSRALIALIALWANLHGAFVIGLVALLIPTTVEAVRFAFATRTGGEPRAPSACLRALGVTSLLAGAAALINPYGWRQLALPFRYAIDSDMMANVREWAPTVLANIPAFVILLVAALCGMTLAPQRPKPHDVALLLAFFGLALQAHRHIGLAALVIAVAAAPSWASLLAPLVGVSARARAALRIGIALALLAGYYATSSETEADPFRFAWEKVELPVSAADFLIEHRPPGQLFNQYYMGGYLIHRFAPNSVVFIDGRNDLYGAEFAREYHNVMKGEPGFESVLDQHRVGTLLVAWHPNNARMLGALMRGGWVPVFLSRDDDGGVPDAILLRDTPEAAALIEKFGRHLAAPGP